MSDSDNIFGFLCSVLMLGGMFCAGKKIGERRTIQQYEDQRRDAHIRRLQEEIESLKRNQSEGIL